MGTRVHWNPDENRIVAVNWIKVCEKQGQDPLNPMGIQQLAAEAQMAITDPYRRRPAESMKSTQSIARLLEYVEIVLKERASSRMAQEPQERQQRDQEAAQAAELRRQQEP